MVVAPPKDKTDVDLIYSLVFQGSFSFVKKIIFDLDLKDFSTTLFGVFLFFFIVVAFSKASYSLNISWKQMFLEKIAWTCIVSRVIQRCSHGISTVS